MPRSIVELLPSRSRMTTTSSSSNMSVAYPAHVVLLSLMERTEMYLADHCYAFLVSVRWTCPAERGSCKRGGRRKHVYVLPDVRQMCCFWRKLYCSRSRQRSKKCSSQCLANHSQLFLKSLKRAAQHELNVLIEASEAHGRAFR